MKANHGVTLGCVCAAFLAQTGCDQPRRSASESKRPRLVFITTGTNLFWQDATEGIEAAARAFKVEFEILPGSSEIMDQEEPDGIAFTPINGHAQLVASGGRVCFVGVDHYKAGRRVGALVREELPENFKIVIVSTTPDYVTSQERRRGLVDEFDETPFLLVEANSKQLLLQHMDAGLMIALSSRDMALCMDVLCMRDKLGHTRLLGFEYDGLSRDGLAAEHVYAIVTPQSYEYGYHAVRVLAGLARDDVSVLPRSGFLELAPVVLRSETASQAAARTIDSAYDSTLFPRGDAGDLDRAAQAGNLAADRTARQ